MSRKRLVSFVEGQGDAAATPILLSKIVTELSGHDIAYVDPSPFTIKGIGQLSGKNAANWPNKLRAAALRGNLGGVLLLIDGDSDRFEDRAFCPVQAAQTLSERARGAGAGTIFSVVIVFACQEYESWLLAGIESLAGMVYRDGTNAIRRDAKSPKSDLDSAPRNAKGPLGKCLTQGYNEAIDQEVLTQMMALDSIRSRGMRSFRRLESAVSTLVKAFRDGIHIVSPS